MIVTDIAEPNVAYFLGQAAVTAIFPVIGVILLVVGIRQSRARRQPSPPPLDPGVDAPQRRSGWGSVQGRCYTATDDANAPPFAPTDCDSSVPRLKVAARFDGSSDTASCPAGTREIAYQSPARLY